MTLDGLSPIQYVYFLLQINSSIYNRGEVPFENGVSMLNRGFIVRSVEAFVTEWGISKFEIQILGGAALVLHGLRKEAADIDICLKASTCQRLMDSGKFEIKDSQDPAILWFGNGIFDVRNTSWECELGSKGFMIQTLESLLKLKKGLNRPKDREDIRKLKEAISLKK